MRFLLLFLLFAAVSTAANKYCSFTAANGTDVESYSTSGEAAFTANSAATAGQGVIYNGRLRCNSVSPNAVVVYANNFTPAAADYTVECELQMITVPTTNAFQMGVGGRCGTAAFTGYYALCERLAGAWRIGLYRGGNATPLGTYAMTTPVAGERHFLSMTMAGNDITVYLNGVSRIAVTAAGADIIASAGVASIYLQGIGSFVSDTTGIHMDRWFVSDKESSPATYSVYAPEECIQGTASGTIIYRPTGTLTGTITPTDGGYGGTFSPTSLTWSGTQEPKTATYTAAAWISPAITGTNGAGMSDPSGETLAITHTVASAELWGNGYSGSPTASPLSYLEFSTTATAMTVIGSTDIYGSFPLWAQIGWTLDDTKQTPMDFTANGAKTFSQTLSAGTKRIRMLAGVQTKPSATVLGSYITSIKINAGASGAIRTPGTAGKLLVYGDSISVGSNSTDPETDGWIAKLRANGRMVMSEGYGYRSLNDDCVDASARTTFATRLAGYNPWVIYIAIGTNDYGLNKWSAASFGTAYADLLDKIHTALPNCRIYCQSPIQRIAPVAETANGSGSTLGDYRTQISTAVSARSSYCVYVDGAAGAIISNGGIDTDGLHPTTAGHTTYAAFVHALLPRAAALQGIITP